MLIILKVRNESLRSALRAWFLMQQRFILMIYISLKGTTVFPVRQYKVLLKFQKGKQIKIIKLAFKTKCFSKFQENKKFYCALLTYI